MRVETVTKGTALIAELLATHSEQIVRAAMNREGEVSVALHIKFQDQKEGFCDISTSISYEMHPKIRDGVKKTVNEDQTELFPKGAEPPKPPTIHDMRGKIPTTMTLQDGTTYHLKPGEKVTDVLRAQLAKNKT